MQQIEVLSPGGLDNLALAEVDAPLRGPGEVQVRVQASSLNYHDYIVASVGLPSEWAVMPVNKKPRFLLGRRGFFVI